jgi:hypothetical protein
MDDLSLVNSFAKRSGADDGLSSSFAAMRQQLE